MRYLLVAAAVLFIALAIITNLADAQPRPGVRLCADIAGFSQYILDRYGQQNIWRGRAGEEVGMRLFQNSEGNWMLAVVDKTTGCTNLMAWGIEGKLIYGD